MNVGKYYVAGIPFDSENSLKHYGVKGMEWNKHKFGIDADDRYIKWLKNAGQNIGRFGANVAQNVAKGVTNAARTAGTAVNKGANFVTGNQNRQQYQNQSAAARTMRNPQQAQQRATNYYNQQQAKTLPGIAKTTVNTAKNTLSSTAQGVKNFAGQTAQNAGKALQNVADTAGRTVSGAAQNVENAVGKAAQGVKDYVDYNITGKGYDRDLNAIKEDIAANPNSFGYNGGTGYVSETSGDVYVPKNSQDAQEYFEREAAKSKANSLFGRIENAAQDAGNVAQNVGNTVGQAAQNVGNAVSGAANKAAEGAKGFLNSAGQWVSGAANNVKNTASKATSDAKKGASGFLNSAGQWVSNAAGNVKDAAQNVGNTIGQAAQNVGNTVGQAAQNVGNTVGQAAEQARGGIGGFFDRVGNAVGGAAQNVGNWAGNAAKDVGNAVSGAANAVGDWAGNAAQDVGGAVQNAGNWVGDRARDVNDWYTGGNKGEQAAQLRDQAARTQAYGDRLVDAGVQGISDSFDREPPYRMSPDSSAFAQNAKDQSKVMFDKSLDTRNRGFDEWDAASDLRNQSRHLQDAYDAAPRQQLMAGVNAVGDAVSGAAQNIANAVTGVPGAVADWARNAADNVGNVVGTAGNAAGEWARNVGGNVGNAVSGAAGNVADWARNAAGNVGNWAGQAAQNAGQSVANIPQNIANWYTGQPNADRAEAIDRQVQEYERMGDMMYRQGLQAQGDRYHQLAANLGSVADANQARYDAAPQQRLSTAGQWVGNQAQNVADWWNRRNPFVQHSALDDKPDGVSDAFWEKFTADGGTREDYERDWR